MSTRMGGPLGTSISHIPLSSPDFTHTISKNPPKFSEKQLIVRIPHGSSSPDEENQPQPAGSETSGGKVFGFRMSRILVRIGIFGGKGYRRETGGDWRRGCVGVCCVGIYV
eukprot:1350318-Amorphochlora_amoeboformis.AAC.1